MRFPPNFNLPYTAQGLAEFWRRWHISLSTWLRDYLYIPLGGNRGGELGTYRNLMLTMLLGGLWHGAAWTFVFWGFLHGMGLAVSRAFERARAGTGKLTTALGLAGAFTGGALAVARVLARLLPEELHAQLTVMFVAVVACILLSAVASLCERRRGPLPFLAVLCTFHFTCICWVFFRAPSFGQAALVFRQIATRTTFHPNLPVVVIELLLIGLGVHYLPAWMHQGARRRFSELPGVVQGLLLFGVALFLHEAASATAVPFVYFQF